ncbi:MAG TPA: plasmid partition protein ParG [Allosphingosinicella sp.]|nr:plasmid partition protein ParG [Allosphingosinicella sp.]
MNEARYASLSSGLLARKGTAKPAMRPQGFTPIEDLGWNDMGYVPQVEEQLEPEVLEHVPSSISALTPAPRSARADGEPLPVVAQQRAIAESFEVEEAEAAVVELPSRPKATVKAKVVSLPKRSTEPAGKKAAFTLRLDSERHLRLRLACAVTGRSAQQIVTQALDDFLESLPEIETMAKRVPASGAARN